MGYERKVELQPLNQNGPEFFLFRRTSGQQVALAVDQHVTTVAIGDNDGLVLPDYDQLMLVDRIPGADLKERIADYFSSRPGVLNLPEVTAAGRIKGQRERGNRDGENNLPAAALDDGRLGRVLARYAGNQRTFVHARHSSVPFVFHKGEEHPPPVGRIGEMDPGCLRTGETVNWLAVVPQSQNA